MKTEESMVHLNLEDNTPLSEIFAGRSPGEKITLEIEVQINELGEGSMTGSVNAVSMVGGEETPPEPVDEAEIPAAAMLIVGREKERADVV